MKSVSPPSRSKSGTVRLIAGQWRGSRLPIPDVPGLRPSSDRVRETLFNWLQTEIAGARCLDVFSGTGALGFEAASRGAARVVMLEYHPAAMAALRASASKLQAGQIEIIAADAMLWLTQTPTALFDLAFVDPPFAKSLLKPVLAHVLPWLAPRAQIYVEYARGEALPVVPGFEIWRHSQTRDVEFCLLRRNFDGCNADSPATLPVFHAPSSRSLS